MVKGLQFSCCRGIDMMNDDVYSKIKNIIYESE